MMMMRERERYVVTLGFVDSLLSTEFSLCRFDLDCVIYITTSLLIILS